MSHFDTCPHGFPMGQCPSPGCSGRRQRQTFYHEMIEWAPGPPTREGLFAFDKGPEFQTWSERIMIARCGEYGLPGAEWVKAHLQLPEPPMPKPDRIEFPLFARLEPVNLDSVRGEGTKAITEAFRVLGVTSVKAPKNMEEHPVVAEMTKIVKKLREESE